MYAANVSFDGNGTGATALDVAANWSTNVLPVTTDQTVFTEAAFGGPLPSVLTVNASGTTWGGVSWDNPDSALIGGLSSGTAGTKFFTLSGNGGSDLVRLGPSMTSGSLTFASKDGLGGTTGGSVIFIGGSGNLNVVNAGATLIFGGQFNFGGANAVITKTGAGAVTFSNGNNAGGGANTKFILDQGTLNLNSNNGLGGNSSLTLEIHNGTFLDSISGSGFDVALSANYKQTWTGDFTFKGSGPKTLSMGTGAVTMVGGTRQITVNGSTLTQAGVIGDGGNGYGLTKAGPGSMVLTGANTYSGTTSVDGGTLQANFSAIPGVANVINQVSDLKLGGGTMSLAGKASTTNSQTFNGVTIKPGASGFSSTSGTTGTMNAVLGTVTRNVGGTLNVTLPVSGTTSVSNANDANGLLGPGITVGGTDWATVSGGNVVAFTGYTAQNAVGSWGANQNLTTTGAVTGSLGSSLTINSLRLNGSGASALALGGNTLTVLDGLLITGTVNGAQTISGGSIQGSAGGDLVVINNGNTGGVLTISSAVIDNSSATAFTKSGARQVTLSGAGNSYTGATYVNAGTLAAGVANTAFGNNSAVVISTGATVNITGFNETIGSLASNTPSSLGAVTLGSQTLTTGGNNTSTTFAGVISGTGGLTKVGTGAQTLTGINTYSGQTNVNGGKLLVNGSIAAGPVNVNGGTLGGTGTINGFVTTQDTSSFLSPGNNGVGTLTLASDLDADLGAHFAFELGTNSDLLNIGAGNFFGSSASGGLLFDFTDAGGLLGSTPYTLLTFGASFGLDSADLLANSLPSGFALDNAFGTNGFQINSGSLQVQFVAVPEPSTYAMLFMGALAFLGVRRRKANF